MFERDIARWQREQRQMRAAQRRYDAMEPAEDPPEMSGEELARHEAALEDYEVDRYLASLEPRDN
jgi:hypothetical protein